MMRPTPTRLTWRLLSGRGRAARARDCFVAAELRQQLEEGFADITGSGTTFDVNNVTTDSALTALLPVQHHLCRSRSTVPATSPIRRGEMWVTPTSKQPTGIDYEFFRRR